MIELDPPKFSAAAAYDACVSGVRDVGKAAVFAAAKPGVEKAETEFLTAASTQDFGAVVKGRCPSTLVSKQMMEQLYSAQLVRRGSKARHYYDNLRASSRNGICPFCVHRQVTTVDHFMPKAHFPDLAVTPSNLIPACSDCNKIKLAVVPGANQPAQLNPYFDRLNGSKWLRAEVLQTTPSVLRFSVNMAALGALDATLVKRLELSFTNLALAELYAAEAANELLSIKYQLGNMADLTDGTQRVQAWLSQRAASCYQDNPNSWRTAAYEAWSASNWLCSVGHR